MNMNMTMGNGTMNMNMSMGSDSSCPMMTMYFHSGIDDCILFEFWQPSNDGIFVLSCLIIILLCILRELVLYTGKWYETRELYDPSLPFWHLLDSNNKLAIRAKRDKRGKRGKKGARRQIKIADDSDDDNISLTGDSPNNDNNNHSNDQNTPKTASLRGAAASNTGHLHQMSHDMSQQQESRNVDEVAKFADEIEILEESERLMDKRVDLPLYLRVSDSFFYGVSLTLGYGLMLVVMTYNVWLVISVILGYVVGRVLFWVKMKELSQYVILREKQVVEILARMENSKHEFVKSNTFRRLSNSLGPRGSSPASRAAENQKIAQMIDTIGNRAQQGFSSYFHDGADTVGLRSG